MLVERFPGSLPAFAVPILFGGAVMVMIYAVGHISGAHFNPAVTLAFAVVRHFSWKEVWIYWLGQALGAFLALLALHLTLPAGLSYGSTVPHLAPFSAFIWEAILSFFLMFVISAVATDTRAVGIMAGVAIGSTVMLAAFIGGPLTGASMNPIRSLMPALFEGNLRHLGLYILGPCLGTVAGAWIYEKIRCHNSESSQASKGCC